MPTSATFRTLIKLRLVDTLTDSLVVSLTQVRTCLATDAEDKDWTVLSETAAATRLIAPAHSWARDVAATVVPLIPIHFAGLEGQLGRPRYRLREDRRRATSRPRP